MKFTFKNIIYVGDGVSPTVTFWAPDADTALALLGVLVAFPHHWRVEP